MLLPPPPTWRACSSIFLFLFSFISKTLLHAFGFNFWFLIIFSEPRASNTRIFWGWCKLGAVSNKGDWTRQCGGSKQRQQMDWHCLHLLSPRRFPQRFLLGSLQDLCRVSSYLCSCKSPFMQTIFLRHVFKLCLSK